MTEACRRVAAVAIVALGLSGCVASAGITGATSQASALTGAIDQAIDALILQKLQDLHNLSVAIQQINAAPGMVQVMMPPPVVTMPSAPITIMPLPAPTTVTPPSTAPTPGFPASPPVTPTPAS